MHVDFSYFAHQFVVIIIVTHFQHAFFVLISPASYRPKTSNVSFFEYSTTYLYAASVTQTCCRIKFCAQSVYHLLCGNYLMPHVEVEWIFWVAGCLGSGQTMNFEIWQTMKMHWREHVFRHDDDAKTKWCRWLCNKREEAKKWTNERTNQRCDANERRYRGLKDFHNEICELYRQRSVSCANVSEWLAARLLLLRTFFVRIVGCICRMCAVCSLSIKIVWSLQSFFFFF